MSRIDLLLHRLHNLADKYPQEERPSIRSGASDEAIAELNASLPAALPIQVAEFLRACDEVVAMDVWNGYWLGGVKTLLRSIRRGDPPAIVDTGNGLASVTTVATDGGGNAFVVLLRDGSVWKWDHETGRVHRVAHDFLGFVERMADDFERYLLGDDAWHYL